LLRSVWRGAAWTPPAPSMSGNDSDSASTPDSSLPPADFGWRRRKTYFAFPWLATAAIAAAIASWSPR
jgi:hypothetical protein